jgi:hypothetical protein
MSRSFRARLLAVFWFIAIVSTIFIAAALSKTNNSTPRAPRDSEEYLIKRSIADFVYAINHRMVGLASSRYRVDHGERSAESISLLVSAIKADKSSPFIFIENVQIDMSKGRPVVSCRVHWGNGRNESAPVRSYAEVFTMEREEKGYVIMEAKITPGVIANWEDRRALNAWLDSLEEKNTDR